MAVGYVPPPGSEYGPCEGPCGHLTCTQMRAVALTPCYICDAQIGYETRFYNSDDGRVHAACAEAPIAQYIQEAMLEKRE